MQKTAKFSNQIEQIELSHLQSKNLSIYSKSKLDESAHDEFSKSEAFEKVYYLASMCIKFEKYEDAIRYVDEMVKLKDTEMSEDERNVFTTAYKFYLSQQRTSWRSLYSLESSEKQMKKMVNEVKLIYEENIIKTCEKIIALINNYIVNKTKSDSGMAWLLKMKADHYRYMAEITRGQQLYNNKQNAFQFYKQAYEQANKLDDIDVIKLGVSLNFSVFLYEILNKRIISIFYTKEALTKALHFIKNFSDEELEDEKLKESLIIIQLMNKNIHKWYDEELEIVEKEEKEKPDDDYK